MLADVVTSEVQAQRKLNYQIAPLMLDRWSPRSMTGELLTDEEFFPLFEAARWAPSSYNSQLWRFIVARRQNREEFDKFFGERDMKVALNSPAPPSTLQICR